MKNSDSRNFRIYLGLITVLLISIAAPASAAVGDCIEGMVNVYDHACDTAENQSGECTTRLESTPEAAWCCCDADYDLSKCATLFDGIFGAIGRSASNAMFISRNVRDSVLDKSPLGSEYIDLYYANRDNMINLLIVHPELAKPSVKVFNTNVQMLVDLSEGKQVTLKEEHQQQMLDLLKAYRKAAGKDSELGKAVSRLYRDLESGEALKAFNIRLVD